MRLTKRLTILKLIWRLTANAPIYLDDLEINIIKKSNRKI